MLKLKISHGIKLRALNGRFTERDYECYNQLMFLKLVKSVRVTAMAAGVTGLIGSQGW